MAARSHVTYLTACNSQSRDLHNRKTTTTTDMEEHEEMSCIKWSKARPLTASSLGSFRFLLGSEPGRLCGVDECQNGYDFMGLILECLLKNRYSHYLSYETILGLCLIILAWDSGRKNVMSMRQLFCPDPLTGFEKMAGFQLFSCLKIKCFPL